MCYHIVGNNRAYNEYCSVFRGCPLLRGSKCVIIVRKVEYCPLFRGCPLLSGIANVEPTMNIVLEVVLQRFLVGVK